MDEFIRILISLSLSGTLLIILLCLLKPLYRKRFSKRWQYYIWLTAALRFVLPFSPDASFADSLFDRPGAAALSDSVKIVTDPSDNMPAPIKEIQNVYIPSEKLPSDLHASTDEAVGNTGSRSSTPAPADPLSTSLPSGPQAYDDSEAPLIPQMSSAQSSNPEIFCLPNAETFPWISESTINKINTFRALDAKTGNGSLTTTALTAPHRNLPPVKHTVSDSLAMATHRSFPAIAELENLLIALPCLSYVGIALSATWLGVALLSLVWKILTYRRFSGFLRTDCTPVTDHRILHLLADCKRSQNIRTPVGLYTSPLIASPLLTGFIRPCILLPDNTVREAEDILSAAAGSTSRNAEPEDKLIYIFTHELIHYKRRDMFYKWFVQIICCIHWFNPFVRLLAKETGRACELACDEAVTANLDNREKIAYGNTLLSFLHTEQAYRSTLVSMTLTEGTQELKERLGAIVKSPEKTKGRTLLTMLTTAVICMCATTLGVYAQSGDPALPESSPVTAAGKGTPDFTYTRPAGRGAASPTGTVNFSAKTTLPDDYDKFWERKFVESYSVVVKPHHRCTICGAPVCLLQKVDRYVYYNTKTEAKRGDPNPPGPSGAVFSNHPCYLDAAARVGWNYEYHYWK